MVRLNDMLRLKRIQPDTDVVRQMRHRARVAAEACPELLIDTDDWQVPDRAAWRAYARHQPALGVPCPTTPTTWASRVNRWRRRTIRCCTNHGQPSDL